MDRKILRLSSKIPVMLMGAPGVGKTATVTQFAKELGADLVDIRLAAETPSSFEGKDYVSPESGTLKKARSWWLQRIDNNKEENKITILFFDEYTNAPDALQQLAYSPFNERKLHGKSFDYRLKNGDAGLYVIGAGNRVEDETGVGEAVHATKTRVFMVDVELNVKEWLEWADKNGINSIIKAFIYANPDAIIEKPSLGTACPREWANLSYALDCGIDYRKAAHGTVRGSHESKFCTFYGDTARCPTIEDIVNGTAKNVTSVHLSAISCTLATALKNNTSVCEHFPIVYDWIAKQSPECEVLFAKYTTELFGERLLRNHICKEKLKKAAKKVGVSAK